MIFTYTLIIAFFIIVTMHFLGKKFFMDRDGLKVFGIVGAIVMIVSVMSVTTVYHSSRDSEKVVHGIVTDKFIDKDSYTETYQCGESTCSRTVYTISWNLETTIGDIELDEDEGSILVWGYPDPEIYKNAKIGDPASKEFSYPNYVQLSPKTVFNDEEVAASMFETLPEKPKVYSKYKYNHVVGSSKHGDVSGLNKLLTEYNMNSDKKTNVILVFTDEPTTPFTLALESLWVGGDINDIVVVISENETSVNWVNTFTYANSYGNELFKNKMVYEGLSVVDNDPNGYTDMLKSMFSVIDSTYDIPSENEFKYLESEYDFPIWLVLLLSASLGIILPYGIYYKLTH